MADLALLNWRIYEITTQNTEIHGVMLRGRIRKLGLEQGFNVLCENATDKENCVRSHQNLLYLLSVKFLSCTPAPSGVY